MRNAKPLKKLVLATSLVLVSGQANATFLCSDFPALAEQIWGNIQGGVQWAEQQVMMQTQTDISTLQSQMKVDQDYQIAANQIARDGARAQELQNLEQEQMSVPNRDTCQQLTATQLSNDIACDNDIEREDSREDFQDSVSQFHGTVAEFREHKTEVINDLVEACLGTSEFQGASATDDANSASSSSLCTAGDLVVGGAGQQRLDADSNEKAKAVIDLLVWSVPDNNVESGDIDSPAAKERRLRAFRKNAVKALAHNSLTEVRTMYAVSPTTGLSQMDVDKTLIEKTIRDLDNIAHRGGHANSRTQEGDIAYTPELIRQITDVQGMSASYLHTQNQQLSRIEALMATLVAIQAEPLR